MWGRRSGGGGGEGKVKGRAGEDVGRMVEGKEREEVN